MIPSSYTRVCPPPTELSRFIALEGPAGVGKTEIAIALVRTLRYRGLSVALCSEFSESALGRALRLATDRCLNEQPIWTRGIGGVMAFLADKLHHIESCLALGTQFTVVDRGPWTQSILGPPGLTLANDHETMSEMLGVLGRWLHHNFSPYSLIIFLSAHPSALLDRLQQRCQRSLSEAEIRLLQVECEAYETLSHEPLGWPVHRIDCSEGDPQVLDRIVDYITQRVLEVGL